MKLEAALAAEQAETQKFVQRFAMDMERLQDLAVDPRAQAADVQPTVAVNKPPVEEEPVDHAYESLLRHNQVIPGISGGEPSIAERIHKMRGSDGSRAELAPKVSAAAKVNEVIKLLGDQ